MPSPLEDIMRDAAHVAILREMLVTRSPQEQRARDLESVMRELDAEFPGAADYATPADWPF